MSEKIVLVLLLAVLFVVGAWTEREYGVMWRASILWRRLRAWARKVASTPPSE